MTRMIAFCGLVCTNCEGYLATQANDEAWKERLASRAREEYGAADATAASVTCDGCLATTGRLSGYCSVCQIRLCGSERGVGHCGTCHDFETCEKIRQFIEMVPETRATFEALRANN